LACAAFRFRHHWRGPALRTRRADRCRRSAAVLYPVDRGALYAGDALADVGIYELPDAGDAGCAHRRLYAGSPSCSALNAGPPRCPEHPTNHNQLPTRIEDVDDDNKTKRNGGRARRGHLQTAAGRDDAKTAVGALWP
jgi:hypothetical protein